MGSTITFLRPDGQAATAYLAEPERADDTTPAVVVIQEWWGLNEQIKGMAERLAAAGYRALVPDLYRGQSTVKAEEAHHLMSGLNFADAATQDIRGAVQHLKAQGSPRVGVTGFCMGGALTLLAACQVPEADAAVVWYGCPPLEYLQPEVIGMPIMGHFATQDAFFAIEQIQAMEQLMVDAQVDMVSYHYLAHHAFANETAVGPGRLPQTQYDPVWSQAAWDRTLRFFGTHLG